MFYVRQSLFESVKTLVKAKLELYRKPAEDV